MKTPVRVAGTLVLLALFGTALFYALRSNQQTRAVAQEQAAIARIRGQLLRSELVPCCHSGSVTSNEF